MSNTRRTTQMQRLDKGFAAYLVKRAAKEGCTVVEVTRRMLAAIRPQQKKERTL